MSYAGSSPATSSEADGTAAPGATTTGKSPLNKKKTTETGDFML